MLFACIAITSCTDDDMPTDKASVRDYQTDAEVLAKFVDVNKTLGEYYINENKKIHQWLMLQTRIGKN